MSAHVGLFLTTTTCNRTLLCLLIAGLVGGGCGKRGAKRFERNRDAATVVVVDQTPSGVVFAAEVEPNDVDGEAAELALPGGVRGTLDGAADVDVYVIEVGKAGHLRVQLSGIEAVDLILDLRGADGELLARSDRGPALTSEGLANYPVGVGRYRLAVSEFVKKSARKARKKKSKKEPAAPSGRQGASPPYELTVAVVDEVASGGEVELNTSVDDAGTIELGREVYGFMGWGKDTDLWRLGLAEIAPEYGVDVTLSGVPGTNLSLEVVDADGQTLFTRKGDKDAPLAIRNLVPGPGVDHYFLRISARRSNPHDRYSLRAASRLRDFDEEIEPNDSVAMAMALREDSKEVAGKRRGYLLPGDVDCYRLEAVGTSMLLTVTLTPPAEVDATLEVSTDKGVGLGESNRGKRGSEEGVVDLPIPAGTAVVIKLSGKGVADSDRYDLSWAVAPDTTDSSSPILDEY